MRISDWSSDVCSSDLHPVRHLDRDARGAVEDAALVVHADPAPEPEAFAEVVRRPPLAHALAQVVGPGQCGVVAAGPAAQRELHRQQGQPPPPPTPPRSEARRGWTEWVRTCRYR